MARPAKSLLQRCQERSFRARHHAHLLVSEPDLPCPSLAALQRAGREAETEDAVKEIARLFERSLDSLPAEERQLLPAMPSPGAAGDASEQEPPAASAPRERNEAFLAAVDAALAELTTHTQLSAREEIQAELIRRTGERLAEIDRRLAEDGLTVSGSQGQLRPHPLLSFEAGLRRELVHNLQRLQSAVEVRAAIEAGAEFEDLMAMTRGSRPTGDGAAARRA